MNKSGGPRLIIVCGLPGSGKTTHSKLLERNLGAVRFCPDEWMDALALDVWDEDRRGRIEALQWRLGQELLRLGQTVIIEWGTWGRSERDLLRVGARSLGALVELHYLTATADVIYERISRRAMENPPVTREQVDGWVKLFEVPTPVEMALFDMPVSLAGPGAT
ncbi:MAG TPA: ATP-binding protein [Tepidisphaeraceae bacterium]|jgi:predicted kinase